jgi:cytochrome d ubiquinol oxidase subunit I
MRSSVVVGVSQLDLARLQFAATSIYHFLFVPVTIGLAFLVAILQTIWHRRGDEDYLRLTRFFGALLLINVAVGVVTGLVQEFQFGMAWSSYSRFVGDVFGAPLAIEGLAAFFLESTFLGLWLFGWGRLPKGVHLATIWLVALGTVLSAAFIMAANSWMQHPVGYKIDPVSGRAQLTSIWAVLVNPLFLWAYGHVLLAALVTGAGLMLAVSAWHLRRRSDHHVFRKTARVALIVLVPAALLTMLVGSELGVSGETYQPMKIAAGEALWNTAQPASFTLFQIGGYTAGDPKPSFAIKVPHLLSVLATNSWNGKVLGMNQVNAQQQKQYGAGDYMPNSFISFWSIRIMAYLAGLVFLLALWGVWLMRRKKVETSTLFLHLATWAVIIPFIMSTAGWMLTENGRQPWIVQGLQLTRNGVSPSVSATTIGISLAIFVLLYGAMAIVDAVLMIRYARRPLGPLPELDEHAVPVPAMTY